MIGIGLVVATAAATTLFLNEIQANRDEVDSVAQVSVVVSDQDIPANQRLDPLGLSTLS